MSAEKIILIIFPVEPHPGIEIMVENVHTKINQDIHNSTHNNASHNYRIITFIIPSMANLPIPSTRIWSR